MREFSEELLTDAGRARIREEMQKGELTARETVAVVNAIEKYTLTPFLPEIETALDHEDANVRISALSAICFAFSPDLSYSRVVEMFNSDPDEGVRSMAATTLGGIARGGGHPEVFQMLRSTFASGAETLTVRDAAKRAFLYAKGRSIQERMRMSFEDAMSVEG
jgi:HEAT repeats